MPKPIPYKFRLIYFLIFALFFVIGFPILVFYSAGYSVDETLGLSIRGGIYVSTPEPNTSVFVGNELKSVSGFFKREILVGKLKPGQYLVLAANDDFWPWAKLVEVERGEVESLFPLLVPKVIQAEEIKKTDSSSRIDSSPHENSMYKEVLALFLEMATSTATTKNSAKSPITTAPKNATTTFETITRKNVKIWLDGDTIYGQWLGDNDEAPKYYCGSIVGSGAGPNIGSDGNSRGGFGRNLNDCTGSVLVFRSTAPIRTFDFYPSRDDAIILTLDDEVYAVEIDRRTYQNFYPLYRGQMPDFRVSRNQVYIKDGDKLLTLNLEP
ncbi:MAG: hypothetical protein AAB635_01840 [Patescibacteria group bacterium]